MMGKELLCSWVYSAEACFISRTQTQESPYTAIQRGDLASHTVASFDWLSYRLIASLLLVFRFWPAMRMSSLGAR